MNKFMTNLFGTKTTKRANLRVEGLEDRRMMSVTATWDGGRTGELRIIGDDQPDNVTVVDWVGPNHNRLEVRVDGRAIPIQTGSGPSEQIPSFSQMMYPMTVRLNGGSDSFFYQLADDVNEAFEQNLGNPVHLIDVDLGSGSLDVAGLSLQTASGAPKTLSQKLDFKVTGGEGMDVVFANVGNLNNASLTVRADLGTGNDTLMGNLGGNLGGTSNVMFNVRGGDGSDTIDVRTAAGRRIEIDNSAVLDIALDGGRDADTINCDLWLKDNGMLRLSATGGEGYVTRPTPVRPNPLTGPGAAIAKPMPIDTTKVRVITTDDSNGAVDLNVFEGTSVENDDLQLQAYLGRFTRRDRVRVDGGAGIGDVARIGGDPNVFNYVNLVNCERFIRL